MKNGLSLDDIEKLYGEYDYRVYRALLERFKKEEKINRLVNKLNYAEAVNFGYGGAKTKKGFQSFSKWQRRIINEVNRLNGIKMPTFWDKKKKASFKF